MPPDTNATESLNVAAPVTSILPVKLLPILILVNPSANLRPVPVVPVNSAKGKFNVEPAEPSETVPPLVYGSIITLPPPVPTK